MGTEVTIPVPAGLTEAEARRVAEHALDRAVTSTDIGEVLAEAPAPVALGHLAQLALREDRWRDVEKTWGLLTADEVARLTGNTSGRITVANLRRRHGLAGVKRHGALRYPAFRLVDTGDGTARVPPAWAQLRKLLVPAGWSEADLLAWAAAPNA